MSAWIVAALAAFIVGKLLVSRAEMLAANPRRYAYTVTDNVHGRIASGYAATREEALAIAQELAGDDPLQLVERKDYRG